MGRILGLRSPKSLVREAVHRAGRRIGMVPSFLHGDTAEDQSGHTPRQNEIHGAAEIFMNYRRLLADPNRAR